MRAFVFLCALVFACCADLTARQDTARTESCVLRRLTPEEYARTFSTSLPHLPAQASPAGTPDLVAIGLLLVTAPGGATLIPAPAVGESVYINFSFENQGTGSASNFSLEISIDGYVYCPYAGGIDAPPGSAWTLSCPSPWLPDGGLHQIAGRADVTNSVAELNETNNTSVRIVPVPVALSGKTHGDPPGSFANDVWFSARHKDAVGTWFVAPTSGSLDTLWWVMGDSVGAKDSALTVMIRRSRVSSRSGPGYGYPAPPTSWGRWLNANDADQGIAAFPEEATDSDWISTVGGGTPSFPPVAEARTPGESVTVHRNSVAALALPGLAVTKGETLFVSLRVNSVNAHVADPPTIFAAGRPAAASASRLWKFYEHDAVGSGFVKGWVARGDFSLFLWYSMTAVPTIDSLRPRSGRAGSTVTLVGSGFSPYPDSSVVRFGGVSAGVLAATESTLAVRAPAGAAHAPVTVTNLATHRSGSSRASFSLTFPTNGVIDGESFAPAVRVSDGLGSPRHLAIGDLDGDGKPDLVLADGEELRVFRNVGGPGTLGPGGFVPGASLGAGAFALDPLLADLDGDGRLDLAVSCRDGSAVAVARNTSSPGTVSFAAPSVLGLPAQPNRLCAGDFDGDGKEDIAAGSNAGLLLLRNESAPGTLAFASAVTVEPGTAPYAPQGSDMDGDGRLDLCFTDPARNALSIVRNESAPGTFAFESRIDAALGGGAYGLAVADLDGDGNPDVVAQKAGGGVRMFRNQSVPGSVSLGIGAEFAAGGGNDCRIADIDGDGKPDLVASSGSILRLFQNRSVPGTVDAGSFGPGVDVAPGAAPYGVALTDLDGDAQPDLVVSDPGGGTLRAMRNALRFVIIRGHDPLGSTFSGASREFHAALADDYPEHPESAAVASAQVRRALNGVREPPVPMSHGAGSDWSAELPGEAAGAYVDWSLLAANTRGYLDSTAWERYHVVTLALPDYTIDTGGSCSSRMPGLAAGIIDSARFFVPGADQSLASDNGTAGPVTLGGPFPFFGRIMHYAWIGVDGALALSTLSTDTADINARGTFSPAWDVPWPVRISRDDSPAGKSLPKNLLAPLYHDALLADAGKVRTASEDDCFSVEWDSLPARDLSEAIVARPRFRLLLNRANGALEFHYDRIGGARLDSTSLSAVQPDTGRSMFVSKNAAPAALRPRDGWCLRFLPTKVTHVALQGWNLVSVPALEADMGSSALYPTATSNAYEFQNGYLSRTTLECGVGYWLKFPWEAATRFAGEPVVCDTIDLKAGWNLIGSIAKSVPVASIASIPTGITTSQFFGYRNGYVAAAAIDPGRAYWVKSPVDAQIVLRSGEEGAPSARITVLPTGEEPPPPPPEPAREGEPLSPELALGQNYPNPFNATTMIRYSLPTPLHVRLAIYNLLGQEVAVLFDAIRPAGHHAAFVNADGLPSGMYVCWLRAGTFSGARKILLVR